MRYLWPEYLRIIREAKPATVVGENVTGLLSMEQYEMFARVDSRRVVRFENYDEYEAVYTRQATLLVNDICEDLEKEGYAVQTFVIPAAGVGAPHRRDRIWFVANAVDSGNTGFPGEHEGEGSKERLQERDEIQRTEEPTDLRPEMEQNVAYTQKSDQQRNRVSGECKKGKVRGCGCAQNVATNANGGRFTCEEHRKKEPGFNREESVSEWFQNFPTQSPICGGNDGLPTRLDGVTFSNWRNESIKGFGNAIVPQVAFEIFKAIEVMVNDI